MNLVFESNLDFKIYDYNISHKQLLIRGENFSGDYNIDIVFEGTESINCPTHLCGIKMYQLNQEEINTKGIDNNNFNRVFLIISKNIEYYIFAGVMRVYKNKLDWDESSIDMTGKGQDDLLWISRD